VAITFRRIQTVLSFVIVVAFLSGCGGGGGASSGESYPAKILNWSPPSEYSNGIPLNPATDLDRFEIYVNENGVFSDTDNEMAAISATVSGQPTTSFNLAELAPFLSQGVTYHVAIRTVALNGLKSGFSAGATFSF
jgi:hypothetical protein